MLDLIPATVRLRDYRSGIELDHRGLLATVSIRQSELLEAGVIAGARVVIGHGDGLGFIIDLFAAWEIGAVVVAATPSLTSEERSRVAAATDPALWIGAGKVHGVAWIPPHVRVAESRSHPGLGCAVTNLDAPALVLMTSGTTYRPKGVVHSHRSLRARIALNLAHMPAADLECSLSLMPMHFGHGLIGNCLTPLAAGASLVFWPEPGMTAFSSFGELIDAQRITFLSSVPAMWRIVLRASQPPRLGSLRRVHVGSAPLAIGLWQSIADWCGTRRVLNMYGMTETANWIGGHALEDGDAADGLVGRPWGGAVRVLQANGTLDHTGQGEIAVATPSMMMGYLDQPQLTDERTRGGWFLTGDWGAIDAAGRVRLVGRRGHEINNGGTKVPAEEIDMLLEAHPDVAEACAFSLDSPVAGEIVAVAVVPVRGAACDAARLVDWCEKRIRREAVPSRIFVVASLPRNERGKINREKVRAAVLSAGVREEPR